MQERSVQRRIKVGVLMGGISLEREVSLNSGRTICDHLDTYSYEVVPLFQTHYGTLYILAWHFLHRGKTTDFLDRLHQSSIVSWEWIKQNVDILYLAVHGKGAEDGTLQALLELIGIAYVGSKVFASALRADKYRQKSLLNHAGVATPQGCIIPHTMIDNEGLFDYVSKHMLHKALNYPLIVKPLHEGSSLGVQLVSAHHELLAALRAAAYVDTRCPQDVLIEQKIEGIEFSCTVLSDKGSSIALQPTEIIPDEGSAIFDYHQKYMPGRATKITPGRFSAATLHAIQLSAIQCFETLCMRTIGRIDGFVTPDQSIVIIDINALSGTDPSSFLFNQAAWYGMSHTQLINHIITTELHAYDMYEEKERMRTSINKVQKIRVGVIMGGSNNEKETSLNSGRNVVYKLSPEKYEPIPLFLHNKRLYNIDQRQLVCHSTSAIASTLNDASPIEWSNLSALIDFAFIALHGGIGEDGTLQGALETLNIAYNGSAVAASALCMNKAKTNIFLQQHGFEVPMHTLIERAEWQKNKHHVLTELFEGPWIIKPHDDGCSVLVFKAYTTESLYSNVQKIFNAGKEYVMIEEYIEGMELTVGILGNDEIRILPPTHTVSLHDILSIEEKFLPGQGQNITPAHLTDQEIDFVHSVLKNVYKTIGCKGYARIDCFFQKATNHTMQRLVIIEVNTLPALTPATCFFHQAAEVGIKPMELIDSIIILGFENYQKNFIHLTRQDLKTNISI